MSTPRQFTADEMACNTGTSRSVPTHLRLAGESRSRYLQTLVEDCPLYRSRPNVAWTRADGSTGWHGEDCSHACHATRVELDALGQMLSRGCTTHIAHLDAGRPHTRPHPSRCLCEGHPHDRSAS